MVDVNNLNVKFGEKNVVNDVSFTVNKVDIIFFHSSLPIRIKEITQCSEEVLKACMHMYLKVQWNIFLYSGHCACYIKLNGAQILVLT